MRDETRRAFELFVEKTNKLKSLSFNEAVKNLNLNLAWKKGEAISVTLTGPGSEQIDAFILTFRLFIQDNDQFSFRWLANNALNDPGVSDHWKNEFPKARIGMNRYLDEHPSIRITIQEDVSPTRRDILNVFIYGDLSHVNNEKRVILSRWMTMPVVPGFLQMEFIQILGTIFYQIIIFVANLCEAELKNSSS